MIRIKGHLYHKHNKCTEEDRLKWKNNNDLIWRYFDKGDLYTERCKFCKIICYEPYIPNLKSHLQRHNQEIRAAIQEEIANKSLSQYFKIDEEKFSASCKHCYYKMDIFYGTDELIHHIYFIKNESIRSGQEPEDNDVNRMTQQSINHENTNNFTVQCNIDSCYQTYQINTINNNIMIKTIKRHLYHKHEIWNEEDRLKWKKWDNDLIWRYFDKVGLYKEKCKFCNNSFFLSYTPKLKDHLRDFHRQEIRAMIRKEIADNLLSQYFKIDEEKFSASCKCCYYRMDIFYGTDKLMHHIHFQRNQCLSFRTRFEDNNVNRMIQQSIGNENTSTSSHHDYINIPAPRNQDQQRMMHQFVAAENVSTSSHNDDTNWQALGYQVDQQRMTHQFMASENVATSSHNDDTNWQALGYQINQQRSYCVRRDASKVKLNVINLFSLLLENDRKSFNIILSYVGHVKDQVLIKYVQSSTIFTLCLNYSSNTRTYFIVENIFEVYSLKAGRAEGRRTPQCSFSEFEDGLPVPADIRFSEATARRESLEGAIKVHYFNNRTDSSEPAASDDRKQHPLAAGQAVKKCRNPVFPIIGCVPAVFLAQCSYPLQ
ncbi:hypothetical protein ALC60_01576 [Trachymyrmex zeteki]|uniref:Uncharacterized protein n=1 Tax=Mycetomoellerius zeteki TaxID=64791 RepID=A0A151XG84_9HYME|nr:hypothetical protein ALC60_01576 [Trachymyrmex zeteki]